MKVFISADIEGTNGIVDWTETEQKYTQYEYFAKKMTMEVGQVCEAINSVNDNAEIYVKDAHDTGRNLDHSLLPENVILNRRWSGHPYKMMANIDKSYDAAIMTGYHSGEGSNGNNLAHTMTRQITHFTINGERCSEFLMNYYTALYEGVPVVLVSGDKALCEFVKKIDENIYTVEALEGWGGSVIARHPSVVLEELYEKTVAALKNKEKMKLSLPDKFQIELSFREHREALRAAFYPGVYKINDHTIGFETIDYFEFLRMYTFVVV